jgi:hypothetical protein
LPSIDNYLLIRRFSVPDDETPFTAVAAVYISIAWKADVWLIAAPRVRISLSAKVASGTRKIRRPTSADFCFLWVEDSL